MLKTPNKKMHDFLLGLMQDPKELVKLKTNPRAYLSQSGLSAAHKKVLLGGDAQKIKSTVNKAIGRQQFYPHITPHSTAFHIVIKSTHHSVKLSLKPKSSKSGKISYDQPSSMEAFAIHIMSSSESD